jgi:hypothetical protein
LVFPLLRETGRKKEKKNPTFVVRFSFSLSLSLSLSLSHHFSSHHFSSLTGVCVMWSSMREAASLMSSMSMAKGEASSSSSSSSSPGSRSRVGAAPARAAVDEGIANLDDGRGVSTSAEAGAGPASGVTGAGGELVSSSSTTGSLAAFVEGARWLEREEEEALPMGKTFVRDCDLEKFNRERKK